MRKITFLLIFLLLSCWISSAWAQGVAINTDNSPPDASSILDVSSDTLGILIPRMTETFRDAIDSPANGLLIYQTDNTPGFYYYNGSDWKLIGSGAFAINDLSDGKTVGYSLYLGKDAGIIDDSTDNYNVGVGLDVLQNNTSGYYNTAVGYEALSANTTAAWNTAFGFWALRANISGLYNTAVGGSALQFNTTGDNNTGIGRSALLKNTTGDNNTAIGVEALKFNTTHGGNVAVGYRSMLNNTGSNNSALGTYSLNGNAFGYNNTAFGYSTAAYNSSGNNNTAYGSYANYYNREGSNNTIIGYEAGRGTTYHDKSGNVYIGYQAGYNDTTDNKLYIENSDSQTPLIYGDFVNEILAINGSLGVGTNSPTAILDVNGDLKVAGKISNVTDPTDAQDAATKAYVDLLLDEIAYLQKVVGIDSVADYEGNIYKTFKMGTQIWLAENLRVTKFNDGTAIPLVTDNTAWSNLTSPGYSWYNNDSAGYADPYGALYNYYTVADTNSLNVCPVDWHVPTDAEWTTLITYLGGEPTAGGHMKEFGLAHWVYPNTGATDDSHLTGLPGGRRHSGGPFGNVGTDGNWWSSNESDATKAWFRYLGNALANAGRNDNPKPFGFSVRCLRD